MIPKLFARMEHPVMLSPNQIVQVGWSDGRAVIQVHDVRLPISGDEDGRLGHLGGEAGRALESIHPANAFFLVDGLCVALGGVRDRFPRPEFGPSAA